MRNLVLLAEDNDFVAGLVATILAQRDLRVVRARTGAACEKLFAENAPNLAFAMLDFRLPDTDGATLCHRIRSHAPDLPLVLMSGHAHAAGLLPSGRTIFLAKPFQPKVALGQIDALLGAIT